MYDFNFLNGFFLFGDKSNSSIYKVSPAPERKEVDSGRWVVVIPSVCTVILEDHYNENQQ